MSDSKNDLNLIKKKSKKLLEVSMYQNSVGNYKSAIKEYLKKKKIKERFHLNSIITKNISLFTDNPNYKLLAWLIVQLIIFSSFIFAVNIFKNNLIPYFNS